MFPRWTTVKNFQFPSTLVITFSPRRFLLYTKLRTCKKSIYKAKNFLRTPPPLFRLFIGSRLNSEIVLAPSFPKKLLSFFFFFLSVKTSLRISLNTRCSLSSSIEITGARHERRKKTWRPVGNYHRMSVNIYIYTHTHTLRI